MTIGIVTSVPAAADILCRVVAMRDCQVVWIAASGAEAVARCADETPDLLLIDLLRAGSAAIEATRRIMARTPCAILLITASARVQADPIVEALEHGACDTVEAPLLTAIDLRDVAIPLLTKIDRFAQPTRGSSTRVVREAGNGGPGRLGDWLVAIGASAGGPAVLATLLRQLPEGFPAAIVVVQHVAHDFVDALAAWLNEDSALPVRVALEGDRLTAGSVLLAGHRDHLTLKPGALLGYTTEPADAIHRPSVDVLFRSICQFWPGHAVGVLLTGMGRDGAAGLKALRDRGHRTIAQDQATSAVYGMPKAAANLRAAVDILPADRIAPILVDIVTCGTDIP